jgi:hypothetical protein
MHLQLLSILYALVSESLPDDFGRKPLLLLPLIGVLLQAIVEIVLYVF